MSNTCAFESNLSMHSIRYSDRVLSQMPVHRDGFWTFFLRERLFAVDCQQAVDHDISILLLPFSSLRNSHGLARYPLLSSTDDQCFRSCQSPSQHSLSFLFVVFLATQHVSVPE